MPREGVEGEVKKPAFKRNKKHLGEKAAGEKILCKKDDDLTPKGIISPSRAKQTLLVNNEETCPHPQISNLGGGKQWRVRFLVRLPGETHT